MSVQQLLRPDVREMEPYTPILPFEVLSEQLGRPAATIIKLDANENPYGPSPLVRQRLQAYPFYHIYPDPQQTVLRRALAGYTGLPAERILPGHGADELLDLITRLFVRPGDRIIHCPPTFGMYSFDAALAGGESLAVPRREDFSLDLAGIEAAAQASPRPKLLFLTSPNNPDGGLIVPEALHRLLRLPLLVVLDEAYWEFSDAPSYAAWTLEHENLIVLRTFSKWAGLAGLRLGYGIFPAWLMPHLWKFKQPYNVNVAATVAGLAALEDTAYRQKCVTALRQERDRLYRALGRFAFLQPLPSRANFVLCRVTGGRSAATLQAKLAERGILVRYFDKPGLRNAIRISAGKPEQTDALLEALREIS